MKIVKIFVVKIYLFRIYLQRTIDWTVMLSWPAISLNFHHHRRYQICYHAVRNGIVLPWQMYPVVVVCKQLVDVPIPTSELNHLGHQLSTMASMDVRTFVLYCRLCVSIPFKVKEINRLVYDQYNLLRWKQSHSVKIKQKKKHRYIWK